MQINRDLLVLRIPPARDGGAVGTRGMRRRPRRTESPASALTERGEGPIDGVVLFLGPCNTVEEAIPYWKAEAARWKKHAARYENLAEQLRSELGGSVNLRTTQTFIDLRCRRYWWFNHMAALFGASVARAEQRLQVLQTMRSERG